MHSYTDTMQRPWPDAMQLSDIVHNVFMLIPNIYIIEYWIGSDFVVVDAEMCAEYYVEPQPPAKRMWCGIRNIHGQIPGHSRIYHDSYTLQYLDGVPLHHSCYADDKNAALISEDRKWIVFRPYEK